MPSLWCCRWPGPAAPDRQVVHRALSRWFDDDHHASRKPWSWAYGPDAARPELLIGLLDEQLVQRLRDGAGAVSASVEQVVAVSWAELRTGGGRGEWCVRFVSPVTFRRGNRFVPWPSPAAVFGSLRAVWRQFGAPHAGDVELDLRLDPLVVTAISGASRTERVTVHQHDSVLVGGFVGTVRYTTDGAVDARSVDALARLAPFSGVGSYTTRGFGATRVLGE